MVLANALRFLKDHQEAIVAQYTMALNGTHLAQGAATLGTTFGVSDYVQKWTESAP